MRPPSAAAIVNPLTFFKASRRLKAFCDLTSDSVTTLTDCGISRIGVSVFVAVVADSALKSFSLCPGTVVSGTANVPGFAWPSGGGDVAEVSALFWVEGPEFFVLAPAFLLQEGSPLRIPAEGYREAPAKINSRPYSK